MTSSLLAAPLAAEPPAPAPALLRRVRYEPETGTAAPAGNPSGWPAGHLRTDRPAPAPNRTRPPLPVSQVGWTAPRQPPRPPLPVRPGARASNTAAASRPPARTGGWDAEHTEAFRAVSRQLRTALEVFDGRRPAAHIEHEVTPSVLRYWRMAGARRQPRSPTRFGRMRLCLPRAGVAEVAVTCEIDGRPRAIAARFERAARRGWHCTAIRVG